MVIFLSQLLFISKICLVHMNVFAKFDEIPSMIPQDIKKTKRYGHTFVHSFRRTDAKTVYPPTNTVCGGYINIYIYYKINGLEKLHISSLIMYFNLIIYTNLCPLVETELVVFVES